MIPEVAVLLILASLGVAGVILRWRGRPPSLLGRRLMTAALALGILSVLAPPSCVAPGGAPPAPLAAIVVDLSRSQGGEIGARLGLSEAERSGGERVVVVGAGAAAHLLYDGPRRDLGLSLAIPADLLRAPARRHFDLVAAAELLAEVAQGRPVDLLLLSDGGFDATLVAEDWRERGPSLASLKSRSLSEPRPDDLSLRLVGEPPRFESGGQAVAELLVTGHLARRRQLECRASGGATRSLEVGPGRVRERFLLEVLAPSGGQAEIALRGHEAWDRDRELDRLKLPPPIEADRFRVFVWDPQASLGALVQALSGRPEGRMHLSQGAALPADLRAFDVVVAHDVARPTPLDRRAEASLIRFVENGGGLLLSGADAAFGRGAWAGTPLDELSPLASRPGQGPRSLTLLLDRSGSMARDARFDAAARAARALLETLKGEDQARVWTFADGVEKGTWRGPGEAAAEYERLAKTRAQGGTDLLGTLEALVATSSPSARSTYAFLLTDGRDPRLADAERRRAVLRSLSTSKRRLFVFWFDRESEQEPFLRELVEAGRGQLILLDDFGALARAFFDAAAGGLERRDVAVRNRRDEAVVVARALRTRARPEAEILATGGSDLAVMARWRRGAGRVLAMPVALDPPTLSALFGRDDVGLDNFREELRALAPPGGEGIGELQREGGRWVLRAEVSESESRPRALRWTDEAGEEQELPLTRIGLDRFAAPKEDEGSFAAGNALVIGETGAVLARRLRPGVDLHDTHPEATEEARAEFSRRLRELASVAPPDRASSRRLILLLLALLATDLLLRARGR